MGLSKGTLLSGEEMFSMEADAQFVALGIYLRSCSRKVMEPVCASMASTMARDST